MSESTDSIRTFTPPSCNEPNELQQRAWDERRELVDPEGRSGHVHMFQVTWVRYRQQGSGACFPNGWESDDSDPYPEPTWFGATTSDGGWVEWWPPKGFTEDACEWDAKELVREGRAR